MERHNVLSTKMLDTPLVEMAKAEGINVIEQEAIQVKPILSKEKEDEIFSLLEKRVAYAVFTSSNAVSAVKNQLHKSVNHLPPQWKIFCLSGRTKEMLLENAETFGVVEETASSAAALAKQVIAKGVKELVFFCGDRRRDELPTILQNAGVRVHEVVVYEVEETPAAAAGDYEAVMFFSPSAVQSFFTANQPKENTVCFAIGQATANSVKQFTQSKLVTSKEPTQEALLREVINYFQKQSE
jgi:uroporphyrinogen-III synthase